MKEGCNEKTLAGLRFLLITHTFATGPPQELRDYLIKNNSAFSFLEHPFSYNQTSKHSKISSYSQGKRTSTIHGANFYGSDVLHFSKDFFYTIYLVVKAKQKYDICIAVDNLNLVASFLLKKMGYCKKLIFWTIDYTPKRFNNKLLNALYHSIDRFSCYHSDLLWNSSKRMKNARKQNGVNIPRCPREIIVPDGCHFDTIERNPKGKVNRFSLVFMGHLVKNKGVDLIIESMPELLLEYSQITLTIIGTGSEELNLKKQVEKLNLQGHVFFTGFIKNHKDVEQKIAECGISIAPYAPDPNSYTFFSDVGKVKVYLACGLPVLITDVPEIAQELQIYGAGLIFEYSKESFIKQIRVLLDNQDKYFCYRKNALSFIENLGWDNVLRGILERSKQALSI